jgi:hypothetical protein
MDNDVFESGQVCTDFIEKHMNNKPVETLETAA